MRVWYFTEQSYMPGWSQVEGSIRITPPSRVIDPDIASSFGTALRKIAHLPRHHSKPTPVLASPGGLNGGIKRENIGLKCD